MDKLASCNWVKIASYVIVGVALLLCLEMGLLAGLLAGLLVHETALSAAPWLRNRTGWTQQMGKAVALIVIVAVISLGITAAAYPAIYALRIAVPAAVIIKHNK